MEFPLLKGFLSRVFYSCRPSLPACGLPLLQRPRGEPAWHLALALGGLAADSFPSGGVTQHPPPPPTPPLPPLVLEELGFLSCPRLWEPAGPGAWGPSRLPSGK